MYLTSRESKSFKFWICRHHLPFGQTTASFLRRYQTYHNPYLHMLLHCLIHRICLPAGSVSPSPGMILPPSTAVQPREGAAAADSAGHALQKQIQTETLLGKEGRGLQFALYSELRAGMQWHYVLLCMSCNAHGQPCKVDMLAKALLSLQRFCQDLCHYSDANCQNSSKPLVRWRA